jgi:hypothetical protein
MNCLHNYVVNDTPSFLSQPDRIETVFEMCKHVSHLKDFDEKIKVERLLRPTIGVFFNNDLLIETFYTEIGLLLTV